MPIRRNWIWKKQHTPYGFCFAFVFLQLATDSRIFYSLLHFVVMQNNTKCVFFSFPWQRRYVELLKRRFGENHLHYCDIMLKDIQDSHRINRHVKTELGKQVKEKEDEDDDKKDKKNEDENIGVGSSGKGEKEVPITKEKEKEKEGEKKLEDKKKVYLAILMVTGNFFNHCKFHKIDL